MKKTRRRKTRELRAVKARQLETHDVLQRDAGEPGRRRRRPRTVQLSTIQTAGNVSHDPAIAFSWRVRRMLRPADPRYTPSPCRVYNPDGTLREVLDPFTRKPIEPKERA